MSKYFLAIIFLTTASCAYFSNKTEVLDTNIEKTDAVGAESSIDSKDGRMVYQEKVLFAEQLRRTENEVLMLEDKVYGTRKYNSTGLWGQVRACQLAKAKKDGSQAPKAESIKRPSDNKNSFDDVGLDPKSDKFIGLKEEYLKERLKNLNEMKSDLEEKQDQLSDLLQVCKEQSK